MKSQRYVSDELTHFVGGHLRDVEDSRERADQRYEILLKILRTGKLWAPGAWKGDPEKRPQWKGVQFSPDERLGDMFLGTFVSYCDIPADDVAIHVSKYSDFGLAFRRKFLLGKGANPVLYLAENAVVDGDGEAAGELWGREVQATMEFLQGLMFAKQHDRDDVPTDVINTATQLHAFAFQRLFPLIKPFDAALDDAHLDNYYMEREWRSYGDLDFALDDVSRVYLPERFAKRLREDLPDYFGQVTFAPLQAP